MFCTIVHKTVDTFGTPLGQYPFVIEGEQDDMFSASAE
jgi:hypothetical protein